MANKRRITVVKTVEPDVVDAEVNETGDEGLSIEEQWLGEEGEIRIKVLTADGWVHVGRVPTPADLEDIARRLSNTSLVKPGRSATVRITRDKRRGHHDVLILVPRDDDDGGGISREVQALRDQLAMMHAQPAQPSVLEIVERIGVLFTRMHPAPASGLLPAQAGSTNDLMVPVLKKLIERGMRTDTQPAGDDDGGGDDTAVLALLQRVVQHAPDLIRALRNEPKTPETDPPWEQEEPEEERTGEQ